MQQTAPAATDVTQLGAAELARKIARRELSSVEATKAFIARILRVDQSLNAVVVRLFDSALDAARQADEAIARGEQPGPLHGVPMTVKECFHVAGTLSTIGLARYKDERLPEDGILVRRLRRAGAVILGKTNVPQLMIWHECDNPVYGRTNNPWDLSRTPGGSTGGEAAIIAARGSPLGLGNDLGGSIRVPCHFCGVHGLKPTTQRLPRGGSRSTLRGMETILTQAGPLARRVEDLELAMRALCDWSADQVWTNAPPVPWKLDVTRGDLQGLRVACWTDDGYFPVSPAIARAVREAAAALERRGAVVEQFDPPAVPELIDAYYGLLGSDGGADADLLVGNSRLDWRVKRMLRMARLSSALRSPLVSWLQAMGQTWMARLVALARPLSASGYWQLIRRKNDLVEQFMHKLMRGEYAAFLCPPHALPAPQHVKGIDLIPAASYSFVPNLLGVPAGVVSITRVRAGEELSPAAARDQTLRQAAAVGRGSTGLPVGVQVGALHWREDVVLAVMTALEEEFQSREDYPPNVDVPYEK